uniref:Uncharacterized protein n=1 Tax=Panagrolaimus sp. ES5 TaxID=591445 RepID=A0AC34FK60_9BILA
MTSKNAETNEEKKAAAEKIVNSLKDGVEALNEVLNTFDSNKDNNSNDNDESESDETTKNNKRLTVIEVIKCNEEGRNEEPNYVNIEAIYKKPDIEDKAMAYLMSSGEVVTESEIVSCIESVSEEAEDKTEKTNEEKKAAAEKIVNSLKDGVEALNEVLNTFDSHKDNNSNDNDESESDETTKNNKRLTVIEVIKCNEEGRNEEPNYVNIEAIYKKPDIEDKAMAYLMSSGEVVTESEIVSCIESVFEEEEDKTEIIIMT